MAFASASNANQPGDVQEFAETITGDFDKIVKIASITSGPGDPRWTPRRPAVCRRA